MDYDKLYKNLKQESKTVNLTPEFYQFKEKGEIIVGAFITKMEIPSQRGSGSYYQYIFDTNKGRIKFALGKVTDGAIADVLKEGYIYAITYNGKIDIGGSRYVNDVTVEFVANPDGLTEDGLPF